VNKNRIVNHALPQDVIEGYLNHELRPLKATLERIEALKIHMLGSMEALRATRNNKPEGSAGKKSGLIMAKKCGKILDFDDVSRTQKSLPSFRGQAFSWHPWRLFR
jgi:hypothetical protein